MAKLSVAIITKNEEATIKELLFKATRFADEVVVVDTGSTDKTIEYCKQLGIFPKEFKWCDDFAAARNYAFSQCSNNWVMWLDADDDLPKETIEAILSLKNKELNQEKLIQIFCPYHLSFDENNNPKFKTIRERIVNIANGGQWIGAVHEYFDPFSQHMGEFSIEAMQIVIEHRPKKTEEEKDKYRNLKILEKEFLKDPTNQRTILYLGNEYKEHGNYEKALDFYEKYHKNPGCDWEQYYAFLQGASCIKMLDENLTLQYKTQLMLATKLCPERAEAWYQLGQHHYSLEEYKKAIPYFAAAKYCELPTSGFITNEIYEHLAADLLSVCLHRCGYHEEAIRYAKIAYHHSPDKKRIISNIEFYMQALAEQKKGYLNA